MTKKLENFTKEKKLELSRKTIIEVGLPKGGGAWTVCQFKGVGLAPPPGGIF